MGYDGLPWWIQHVFNPFLSGFNMFQPIVKIIAAGHGTSQCYGHLQWSFCASMLWFLPMGLDIGKQEG